MNKRNKIVLTIASLTCLIILGVTFKSNPEPNSEDTVNPDQKKAVDGNTVSQKNPFGILVGKAKNKTQKGKALEVTQAVSHKCKSAKENGDYN